MNGTRLGVIVLIFIVASGAWLFLGRTITTRTALSESTLRDDVDRMYGPMLEQGAPSIQGESQAAFTNRPPGASEILVEFEHENRNRGLVWFSVYRVTFDATYTVEAVEGETKSSFRMALPGDANIDAVSVSVGDTVVPIDSTSINLPLEPTPEAPAIVHVRYVTSGQDAWAYNPRTEEGGLRNFRLVALTNFDAIDYPATGLSPTSRAAPRVDGQPGRHAAWEYEQMLPARNHTIGVVMPSMPDSGVLSARIARFAPVSLFFFFAVMVVIQVLRGWRLHPLNYLLMAAGFFAFHILLAHLVDHLNIHVSFWIAAAVSVFLVVSYLRLVLGARAAILVAGAAQLLYLVFFSYAFFWQGWTGLTVVIGAIVTLFVIMQLTGRIDWAQRLEERSRPVARPPRKPFTGTEAAPEPPEEDETTAPA